MNIKTTSSRILGFVLFVFGFLLSCYLIAGTTWADLESAFFGFTSMASERIGGFACPVFIAPGESSNISLSVTNPTEKKLGATIRADVATSYSLRSERGRIEIGPGETRTLLWPVSADDAVMGRFVFAKVYMYAAYPLKSAEASCGSMVVDTFGLPGMVYYWLLCAVSVVALVAGILLTDKKQAISSERTNMSTARKTVAVLAVIGLAGSYAGMWPLGVMVMAILVLTVTVLAFVAASQ
jgi:hypothetical protein